jgi:hypothetical protein
MREHLWGFILRSSSNSYLPCFTDDIDDDGRACTCNCPCHCTQVFVMRAVAGRMFVHHKRAEEKERQPACGGGLHIVDGLGSSLAIGFFAAVIVQRLRAPVRRLEKVVVAEGVIKPLHQSGQFGAGADAMTDGLRCAIADLAEPGADRRAVAERAGLAEQRAQIGGAGRRVGDRAVDDQDVRSLFWVLHETQLALRKCLQAGPGAGRL